MIVELLAVHSCTRYGLQFVKAANVHKSNQYAGEQMNKDSFTKTLSSIAADRSQQDVFFFFFCPAATGAYCLYNVHDRKSCW